MDKRKLVGYLRKVGWKEFTHGDFFDIKFDLIGKSKTDGKDWFVLLKSLEEMDAATLARWNANYQKISKKSRSGIFTLGRYFVLILVAYTISEDVLQQLLWVGLPDMLKAPEDITRGGGFTLLLVIDRKEIFKPKTMEVSNSIGSTELTTDTYRALNAFKNKLSYYD